tara:strand:+ start:3115 stop:3708 length:594 start_codon:yes stop_codon:yes gene_type:complete
VKTIDFYFDIYSPYAYLASHRLAEIVKAHNCKVNYLPIDLKRAKLAAGNTGPANMQIPPKIKYLMQDLARWADRYGIPFGVVPRVMDSNRINKGVFFAIDHGNAADYIREAYAAVWGRGEDMTSDKLLSEIAAKMGWDPMAFLAFIDSSEAEKRYQAVFDDAVKRGVFGVPMYFVDEQMWWGNDRLHFLDEYLEQGS